MWQVLSLRAVSLIESHIYSFNHFIVKEVEDSVGVRVLSVTKHKTFMCFRCKFGSVMWILDPAPVTEDFEIANVWLLTIQEFIGCLLEELMKINSVDDMASSINGFRPELSWSLVLIKHRTSHLNKSPILALHDAILLRCVWSRELMSHAQCIKISVEACVLEFRDIATSDVLDLD